MLQLTILLICPSNLIRNYLPQSRRLDSTLTVQQVSKLNRIIKLAENLIAKRAEPAGRGSKPKLAMARTRKRRTGKELAQFRKMLKAERKEGIPVSEMARKHGISTAYIYLL